MQFEYTAVPAPARGEKSKDARTPGERYALSLTAELNRMASDGWEYLRADVLPSEERTGLTGRTTVYHNLLIFRRAVVEPVKEAPVAAKPVAKSGDQHTATPPPADEPASGASVDETSPTGTVSEKSS